MGSLGGLSGSLGRLWARYALLCVCVYVGGRVGMGGCLCLYARVYVQGNRVYMYMRLFVCSCVYMCASVCIFVCMCEYKCTYVFVGGKEVEKRTGYMCVSERRSLRKCVCKGGALHIYVHKCVKCADGLWYTCVRVCKGDDISFLYMSVIGGGVGKMAI